MAIKMRIETPVAFGLTLTVCLVLFFYCWRIRKIRHRLTGSVQVSALPIADSTVPAEEQTGIKKEVIATFPTVKAHELKDDIKEGCPICLVEYADAEVLRRLPLCGHVFHIRCVDSWLENQVTCPVCRIVLTGARSSKVALHRRTAPRHASVTVDVPAWVLVNRPMPLPPATAIAIAADGPSPTLKSTSERHMDSGVSPLLEHNHIAAGWGAVYLENHHAHGLVSFSSAHQGIQTKECIHHDSISERWMTESFVFGISSSGSDADQSPKPIGLNARELITEWEPDEVLESRVAPFRPLTMSPERCSFEFLPVVTGDGSSSRSPRAPWVGTSRHSFYSQL